MRNPAPLVRPDTSRRALAAAAAPVSMPSIILGFLVAMLGLWVMIRLLLLPARGAIGEGSGLAACWRDTRGVWWWLFRLMMIQAAIAVVARVISGAVFALIAFVAVAFGWITAPASMTVTAIYQWLGSPNLQSLSLVHSVLVAPVFGTVTFIFAGSIIRAALLVRNDIEAARSDPYGRVLAEWQAEQAKSMPRNNAWQ